MKKKSNDQKRKNKLKNPFIHDQKKKIHHPVKENDIFSKCTNELDEIDVMIQRDIELDGYEYIYDYKYKYD
jgi:hypothetical protein